MIHFLTPNELWLALLLVGMSMVWTSTLPWAVLGLGVLSLLRWLSQGSWSVRTPVDGLVLVLTGMAFLSLWITPLPEVTRPQVYRLWTGLGFFYVLINWLTSFGRAAWLAVGAAGMAPAFAVLAVFSVEWPAGKLPLIPVSLYDHFSSLFQDAIHPNVLAGNLAVVLPLGMAFLLFGWGNVSIKPWVQALLRVLLAAVMAFSILILFLTQSRGAWMALALAVCVLIVLRFRWGWLMVLLAGAASLGGVYYFVDISWLVRWLRSSYLIGDLRSRMELWARGLFMLEDFFFTGIGMGTFAQTTDALYPLRGKAPPHVHNLYLQVGLDVGVPGLLAWLAIFLIVTWAAWCLVHQKNNRETWFRSLGAGILGSQAALALHGMFDSVTWGMIRPAPLIWGLWGLCLGVYLLTSRQLSRDA